MPWYRTQGKLENPMTDKEFLRGMEEGLFIERKHKGFCSLLYYSAVRKSEALRAKESQFKINGNLSFSVGKRLKHGITTPFLNIPLEAPYVDEIVWSVENTDPEERVWPYSSKTGYNIVHRVFPYPHYFRLSRITNFFLEGWTIAQVHSWTGLTLKALDSYMGIVDVQKMGESLKKRILVPRIET